mmetsp:Transcript_30753/g.56229  ORF Transcript_30753/g.56229 Transcript_30753/m.56229 type:complete len:311 (-) Transcript_30753:183-1115(-)
MGNKVNLPGGGKPPPPGAIPPGSPAHEAAVTGQQYAPPTGAYRSAYGSAYGSPYAREGGPVNFCPYCGETVAGTFLFCTRCGREMPYVGGPTLFDLVDANHDGVITRDELDRALNHMGPLWHSSHYAPRLAREHYVPPRMAVGDYYDMPAVHYRPEVIHRTGGFARPSSTFIEPAPLVAPTYSRYPSFAGEPSYQLVKKRYAVEHGVPTPISREVLPPPPALAPSHVPPITTSLAGPPSHVPPITTSLAGPTSYAYPEQVTAIAPLAPPLTSYIPPPGSMATALPVTGRSMAPITTSVLPTPSMTAIPVG